MSVDDGYGNHDLGSQRSSVEAHRFHAEEGSMDRLKRRRVVGGSRRFDSEGAQIIAELGDAAKVVSCCAKRALDSAKLVAC